MIKQNIKQSNEVKVYLLGKFQIEYQGNVMTSADLSSNRLLKLIAYLLYHHAKRLTAAELIQNIWENEELLNHKGALKNLIYRLRSAMKACFGDVPFWLTDSDGYYWNTELPISLDTDIMDRINIAAAKPEELRLMIDHYHGRFMYECEDFYWVMCMQVFYQNRYTIAVDRYCEFLSTEANYHEICEVTKQGIETDILEEIFHYWFIYSLIKQGKYFRAEQTFEEMKKRVYGNEVEYLSDRMRYLKSLIETRDHVERMDMQTLLQKTVSSIEGARILSGNRDVLSTILTLSVVRRTVMGNVPDYELKYLDSELNRILVDEVRMSDHVIRNRKGSYTIILVNCDDAGADGFVRRLQTKLDTIEGFSKRYKLKTRKKLVYSEK